MFFHHTLLTTPHQSSLWSFPVSRHPHVQKVIPGPCFSGMPLAHPLSISSLVFLSFSAILVFLSSCKCSHTCIQLFLSPIQYFFTDLTIKPKNLENHIPTECSVLFFSALTKHENLIQSYFIYKWIKLLEWLHDLCLLWYLHELTASPLKASLPYFRKHLWNMHSGQGGKKYNQELEMGLTSVWCNSSWGPVLQALHCENLTIILAVAVIFPTLQIKG